jgi:hypothetical protein
MVEDTQVVQAVGNLPADQTVGKTSQLLIIFLNQLMFYLYNLKINEVVGCDVLMAVTKKKSMVFWVETPCSLEIPQVLEEHIDSHLQG